MILLKSDGKLDDIIEDKIHDKIEDKIDDKIEDKIDDKIVDIGEITIDPSGLAMLHIVENDKVLFQNLEQSRNDPVRDKVWSLQMMLNPCHGLWHYLINFVMTFT